MSELLDRLRARFGRIMVALKVGAQEKGRLNCRVDILAKLAVGHNEICSSNRVGNVFLATACCFARSELRITFSES